MPVNTLADGTLHSRAGHRSLTQPVLQGDLGQMWDVLCIQLTAGVQCEAFSIPFMSVEHWEEMVQPTSVGPAGSQWAHMDRVWLRAYGVDEG